MDQIFRLTPRVGFMKHLLVCSLYILLSCNQIASAQAELDKARELAKSALRLEQKEEYSEAIRLLEEAQKLDPTNDIYPYELAYVHYVLKDYKKAAGILEVVLERSSGMALLYQLLGNCYDLLKDPDRAIATYKKGLEYFPNSGPLFLELGTMELMSKNYDNALRYYEKGIELDPQFPSNYYRAAQIYCGSTERVWGLIYGELFMNIERNSERTVFVSKMLYETYKSAIVFNSDPKSLTNLHVAFCKNSEIKIDDRGQAVTNILPFGIGVYEPTFALSMIPIIMAGKVDLDNLCQTRAAFVQSYFKRGFDTLILTRKQLHKVKLVLTPPITFKLHRTDAA